MVHITLIAFIPTAEKSDENQEDWENGKIINFTYQDLSQEYQVKTFIRCLQRCKNAEIVRLEENRVSSLNSLKAKVTLPNCTELYAAKNHFSTFDDLPIMPKLIILDLTRNNIVSADGLDRYPNLCHLLLHECPITFTADYRGVIASANKAGCLIVCHFFAYISF